MTTEIARFATLDDAESALDWIGIDAVEAEDAFEGELDADDHDLLVTAVADPDTPGPVRDLARALLGRWDEQDTETLAFRIGWGG